MPRQLPTILLAALLTGTALPALALTPLERIEPAFWWVGMHSEQLQLMVHGERIAEFVPQLRYPGVRLLGVKRLSNPNYVFLDLQIGPKARAGKFEIVFRKGKQQIRAPYQLKTREPGSAQRDGFNASDAILNLMPDRFANGDPANDTIPGYADPANRADDSAGRHGGDLKGMADHLDYIADLGYTALWPTPLTDSNQAQYSYHGYAATDTYQIDPRYGSNEEYRQFVAKARSKGIKVIQDIVLNHIGDRHWWMQDLPSQDWLGYDSKFVPTYHARTTASDPYAAQVDKQNYAAGWFEEHMPDMNQKNPLLATYQIQNTIWWIEYAGLAGIRADTYGYSDQAFLAQWSRRVLQEYPKLNLVGEEWSTNPVNVAYWLRGKQNANGYVSSMPSMMDYPLHDTLRKALVAPDSLHSGLADLYEALVNDSLYPEPNNMVLFEGNHDVSRLYSALNHDFDLYKMALAYILTMRGIPQFYYGTELLMTSPLERDDGAFRKDFAGGWAGDKVNAFTGAGLTEQQKEAQAYLKKLLNWRKGQPVVHNGKLLHYAPQDGAYVYFRYSAQGKVMLAFNKNTRPVTLDTARFREMLGPHSQGRDVLSGQTLALGRSLTLPARGVLVLEVK
ncbi:MAG: glycoside hydrolase family 13 protein [Burkholderiales bacterium]|nr:glycoside hydrolase family 13 protein [Burkholderiales bacterium]